MIPGGAEAAEVAWRQTCCWPGMSRLCLGTMKEPLAKQGAGHSWKQLSALLHQCTQVEHPQLIPKGLHHPCLTPSSHSLHAEVTIPRCLHKETARGGSVSRLKHCLQLDNPCPCCTDKHWAKLTPHRMFSCGGWTAPIPVREAHF